MLIIKNKNQQKKVNTCSEEGKYKEIHRKMPVFTCSCGAKILIVPDLTEMIEAIRNHLEEHNKLSGQILTETDLTQDILLVVMKAINAT